MLNRTYLKRSTFPIFTKKEARLDFLILPIAEIEKITINAVISALTRTVGQFLVKIFLFFFLLYSTIKSLTVSYSLSITSCKT